MEVTRQFRTGDKGFVEDLYALLRLKGNGLPSKQRTDKLAQYAASKAGISPVNAKIIINKRAQILKQSVSMAYFRALMNFPDPVDAVRRMLLNFQKLYLKYREAQCRTCSFMSQCDFGKQYGNATVDIRRVADVDFKKKVHPSCPVLPQIEMTYQFMEAMASLKATVHNQMEEAEVAGVLSAEEIAEMELEAEEMLLELDSDDSLEEDTLETEEGVSFASPLDDGKGRNVPGATTYRGSHDGREYVKQFETMMDMLTKEQLMLFELGRKFTLALTEEKKGEFKPTDVMSQDRKVDKIETLSDITKLVSSEHGLPDEVFDKRLEEKSLQKNQDLKRIQKKKLLYLLIDNSGSMGTTIQGNRYGMLSRGALAVVFSTSLTKRVRDDGGMVFFRFFGDAPSSLMSARAKDEFDPVMKMMAHMSFNGGGTDIVKVIRAAVKDIKNAKDEIAKSEIILISDCEDSFDAAAVRGLLGNLEMNVLDISGNKNRLHYDGSKALKAAGAKYHIVDPQNVDIKKIVEII